MTCRPLIAALALLGSLAALPAQAALGSAPADRAQVARPAAVAQADALIGAPAAGTANPVVAPRRTARVAASSMVESNEAAPVQSGPAADRTPAFERI